jgi:hypothetical protein
VALENIKAQKEKDVLAAFLQYLAVTGIFAEWEKNHSVFESIHVGTNIIPNAKEWQFWQGEDPIFIWQQLKGVPEVAELADFAIMLLSIIVNQAGCERDFSDLKIKKTCLRNRLGLPKLHKMSKVWFCTHAYCPRCSRFERLVQISELTIMHRALQNHAISARIMRAIEFNSSLLFHDMRIFWNVEQLMMKARMMRLPSLH